MYNAEDARQDKMYSKLEELEVMLLDHALKFIKDRAQNGFNFTPIWFTKFKFEWEALERVGEVLKARGFTVVYNAMGATMLVSWNTQEER